MMKKLKENWQFAATAISGILILIGWRLDGEVSGTMTAVIFVAAFIIGGFEQARDGIRDTIKTKKLNVELLMVLAATGASIIGYWLEGAVLIFIFSLSGALETYTTNKSRREITKLMSFQPETAFLLLENGELQETAVDDLKTGQLLLVRPGERIPIDGVIRKGTTSVDQAAINGESIPVEKGMDEEVFGGTVNISSAITLEVTKTADQTLFSQIIRMVKEAQSEPSRTAQFIERFEDKYVKIVLLLVLVMLFLPHFAFGWGWNETFYRAMVLLTVASPCALVAAVTPATLAAISNGARNGILFKGGVHLENLKNVKAVAFDKTGTLTQGKPVVTDFLVHPDADRQEVIDLAYAVEKNSMHPLAKAIVNEFGDKVSGTLREIEMKDVPGFGVEAIFQNQVWRVGKAFFKEGNQAENFAESDADHLVRQGKTLVYVTKGDKIVGLIGLKDVKRDEAVRAIAELKRRGIKTIMVTGDNEATGLAIGAEIGIDYVIAGCLPENKVEVLEDLKSVYGAVAMVGDGINDAPALAHATVGVAMGEGTDIAMETADVVLMKNDLEKLAYARTLSVRLDRVVKQNIAFAILVIISLVIANLFQTINLPFGVIGHEGSTILVILNGLRLLLPNRKLPEEKQGEQGQVSAPQIYRLKTSAS
ncbi:cadmium-translocating P-type ATPase [Listeria floridensis FSL S10-1187]|uniref:Cadmium-translocating P-type ATPase n=1 Tax=Listeria floridensis FSL S10-1187 TaxID=1265817 RepID=A0ABP3AWN6_9LIST|nr:heavy metal translocating P-type ATPase [Listeria floridensis]EUJ30302.1 cadmium-translocating P-type ATPase [Listeria floridensis FSL S10-1187]